MRCANRLRRDRPGMSSSLRAVHRPIEDRSNPSPSSERRLVSVCCSGLRPMSRMTCVSSSTRDRADGIGMLVRMSPPGLANCFEHHDLVAERKGRGDRECDGPEPIQQCACRSFPWNTGRPRRCRPSSLRRPLQSTDGDRAVRPRVTSTGRLAGPSHVRRVSRERRWIRVQHVRRRRSAPERSMRMYRHVRVRRDSPLAVH